MKKVFWIIPVCLLIIIIPLAAWGKSSLPAKIILLKTNGEQSLTKGEAFIALFRYFQIPVPRMADLEKTSSLKQEWYAVVAEKACQLKLIECKTIFNPEEKISPYYFLKLFFALKYSDQPNYLEWKYQRWDKTNWNKIYFNEALDLQLLDLNSISDPGRTWILRKEAYEIFYRDNIVLHYAGLTKRYFKGLVTTDSEVRKFENSKLEEIQTILENYTEVIGTGLDKLEEIKSPETQALWEKLIKELGHYQQLFKQLYAEIKSTLLWRDETIPLEIREKMKQYDIREVIGEGVYDFRTNPAYRKYNIRNALSKINGIVLQPDEVFNFNQYLATIAVPFRMGWIIQGLREVWAYGGGICGAATTVFRGAWYGGLEILERRPHSMYYPTLYNPDKIGLDATVSKPRPNVRFRNNTGNPIMLYVRYDETGYLATFQILGKKPFQELLSLGPFRPSRNQAYWERIIRYPDGRETKEILTSKYSKVWGNI